MLTLRDVTLCAVASRHPQLALRAMARVMQYVEFSDVLLCGPREIREYLEEPIRLFEITPFDSVSQYSMFVLFELASKISTSHVLLVQWDGFVLNPQAWQSSFLDYDFIGAVWPQFGEGRNVGNGGFSLRSKRLLDACQDPDFIASHPEDLCLCHRNRDLLEGRYNLRFAPAAVAERFSYERALPSGQTFGFHGLFNFPDVMAPEELLAFLEAVPPDMLRARDAYDLGRRLAASGTTKDWACVRRLLLCQSANSYKPLAWLRLAVQYALRKGG